jgi:2-hydroxychromene-2-carboxylate isomerase
MPSIKTLLMPAVSQRLLSRERLLAQRVRAEKKRVAAGARHVLHYFHQVDDPYSALAAASLPLLLERYDVDLQAHVVGPPPDNAAPERERLVAYSRRDAAMLARHYQLDFHDPGAQPSGEAVAQAAQRLVAATETGRFATLAGAVSAALWRGQALTALRDAAGDVLPTAGTAATAHHQAAADRLRQQHGHYLGATFLYAGEWYWGIDRLHHLEQRLQALGAQRPGVQGPCSRRVPTGTHRCRCPARCRSTSSCRCAVPTRPSWPRVCMHWRAMPVCRCGCGMCCRW